MARYRREYPKAFPLNRRNLGPHGGDYAADFGTPERVGFADLEYGWYGGGGAYRDTQSPGYWGAEGDIHSSNWGTNWTRLPGRRGRQWRGYTRDFEELYGGRIDERRGRRVFGAYADEYRPGEGGHGALYGGERVRGWPTHPLRGGRKRTRWF